MVIVRESHSEKLLGIERLERDAAVETKTLQLLLAKRRETGKTTSFQMPKNEDSLQKLKPKVATMFAQLRQ